MGFDHRIFKLKGVVQHYAWGGFDFIPGLLHIENKEQKPFAEYWMGAHANHPASVENGASVRLNEFINNNPVDVLGSSVSEKFDSLPYLFKVLDVRQMLSIQVHPSKASAEVGFEDENNKGIALNAPNRNYKDRNHKPELMVALSDFWLLHGFRPQKEIVEILELKNEFLSLRETFLKKGYKGLYEAVMLMKQEEVNAVIEPLLQDIVPAYKEGKLPKGNPDFWAARAALSYCKPGYYDRGIFSIYFFNLVHLKKGEGIFQPAGMPHAYLEGQNVEIMANSDNVLRAGLTEKYMDVPELMKHVKFETTVPNVLRSSESHRVFHSPAAEFELQQYVLNENENTTLKTQTAEIFLLMDGEAEVITGEEQHRFSKGEAFFAVADTAMTVGALQPLNLFRVTVP